MTEAPEEVAVKTVDPHETPTDEEGEKSSLESLVGAPKEAVPHPVENGTEEAEQKPDVTVKEEADSADSNSKETSGANDIVEEPVASTGDEGPKDSSAAEIEPVDQSTDTTTAPVDADVPEAVSVPEEKSEDDTTSVPAPAGTEENLTNSPEEGGGGIPAEESSVPTQVEQAGTEEGLTNSREEEGGGIPTQEEQETTPEETDPSKLTPTHDEVPDKEIPAESVGSEPATTEEGVEGEANKTPDASAEKSISEAPDAVTPDEEPTATPESSDQALPIPDAHEEEAPVVPADEDVPVPVETGEEGSEGDSAAVDKDLPESKGEADGVHVTDTGAGEGDETDRDGVEDTTTEESSTVGSTDPSAAAGADEEEIKHEQSPPEDATVDEGTVAEDLDVKEEIANTESTLPEAENETDADMKVEESASVLEPQETAPVESTKEDDETESEANKEELPATAEPIGVEDKDLPKAGEQGSEESSVEIAKDSEPSTVEEDSKHSTGILETVGGSVISIGGGVLASAKGLAGWGSSGTEKEAGGEVPEVSTDSKPVDDEVDITKTGDEEDSADPKAVDETGTAETNPQENENADEFEHPTVAHAEKEFPAVDEVPPNVTGSEEAQEHLLTSASNDPAGQEEEKVSEKGASVPSEVPATTSQTEEVSSRKQDEEAQEHLSTSAPKDSADQEEEKESEEGASIPSEVPEATSQTEEVSSTNPGEEAQEHLSTSAPKDSADQEEQKENEEGVLVPADIPAATPQTEEVSSRKPDDEPVVKAVDESQAVPTEQESSSEVENSSSVSKAVIPDQSGSEGVTERSFQLFVPHREVGKKLVEESVSSPLTPCTPGGTPLIKRVEQLEKKLAQFEDKQNSPKSQKSSASTPRSSVDRPTRLARHTLEETLSKGSLLDRVAALERKLDHFFLVSGDQEVVSPGKSVAEEGPATNQPESTANGTPEENAKAPLKPLKLDFDRVATPEPAQRAEPPEEEPVDSKESANTEAVENVAEPEKPKEKSGALENLAESNTAEDSKPPKDVADDSYVKAAEEPVAKKIAEDFKSSNPPTTTAEGEAQLPAAGQEPAAAAPKSSPAKKGKTGGPISKLKARVKGCFAKGGNKSAV